MDQRTRAFLLGLFHVETADQWDETREIFRDASPTDRAAIQTELADLIRQRGVPLVEFERLTDRRIETEDELYALLQHGYDYIFGDDQG